MRRCTGESNERRGEEGGRVRGAGEEGEGGEGEGEGGGEGGRMRKGEGGGEEGGRGGREESRRVGGRGGVRRWEGRERERVTYNVCHPSCTHHAMPPSLHPSLPGTDQQQSVI